jgi:hypothetical protein
MGAAKAVPAKRARVTRTFMEAAMVNKRVLVKVF